MLDYCFSASNSSVSPSLSYHCSSISAIISISLFIIIKAIIMLPLSGLVLYLGYQQWQQQKCSFKNMSNSDFFTYHLNVMELIATSGSAVYIFGLALYEMFFWGVFFEVAALCVEIVFHLLTCLERYMAVVHPITYLGLKKASGVRIRNICVGCAWVWFFGWFGLMVYYKPDFPFIEISCLLTFSFLVVSFCSIFALCALIRPWPGEVGGDRERIDQSKKRAFHTIMAITGVLWLMFVGNLVCIAFYALGLLDPHDKCLLLAFALWFSLPSSLVLPLLLLNRGGKLKCSCAIHGHL